MKIEQILKDFDNVKSKKLLLLQEKKVDSLTNELNDEEIKLYKLKERCRKEEIKIANKLDKEFPSWRTELNNEVQKRTSLIRRINKFKYL